MSPNIPFTVLTVSDPKQRQEMGGDHFRLVQKGPSSPSGKMSWSAEELPTSSCWLAMPVGVAAQLCSHCAVAGCERHQDYLGLLLWCDCSRNPPASKALQTPPPRKGRPRKERASCKITGKPHQLLSLNCHESPLSTE